MNLVEKTQCLLYVNEKPKYSLKFKPISYHFYRQVNNIKWQFNNLEGECGIALPLNNIIFKCNIFIMEFLLWTLSCGIFAHQFLTKCFMVLNFELHCRAEASRPKLCFYHKAEIFPQGRKPLGRKYHTAENIIVIALLLTDYY